MDRPPPPPDAALIGLTRKVANITVVAAADAAGISKTRWVQLEAGHERRGDSIRPSRGKPETVAAMAWAVGVTPRQLLTAARQAGDEEDRLRIIEAASILEGIIREYGATPPEPATARRAVPPLPAPEDAERQPPMGDPAREAAAAPYERAIWEAITRYLADPAVRRQHPGIRPEDIPGRALFGAGAWEAEVWDNQAIAERLPLGHRVWLVADMQARQARRDRAGNTGTAG